MRFAACLIFISLSLPTMAAAQNVRPPVKCSGVVQCAEAMVSVTNALISENAALKRRMSELENQLLITRPGGGNGMQTGAVRVTGSRTGYQETTVFFKSPFRSPPSVFLSARDVNVRDHQHLWVKSISNDRAVIANCRRHKDPERCLSYADDFHFDWIAVAR